MEKIGIELLKPPFKIIHKDATKHLVFACGFYTLERAKNWIERFNPNHYTDKTLRREDCVIVSENKN